MADDTIDLEFRPHVYQRELVTALLGHRFAVAVTHRRWGKTRLAVQLLVHAALRCPHPRPRCGYVAPRLKQAKQAAWMYLTDLARRIPGHRILEAELAVELPGDRRITLYGGSEGNEEAMRGVYFDGVVIDEYADVAPHALDEIVLPTLADRRGWLLVIGTPRGMNAFQTLYFDLAPRRGWHRALYRVDETRGGIPWLSEQEIETQRQNARPLAWRQEWLCDFGAASSDALLSIDLVSAACQREYLQRDIDHAPMILGVDVARYGDDRSVLLRRQGLCAFAPQVHEQVDNMRLAGLVAQEIQRHAVRATFIDAGRGEGVIDRLRQLGYLVHEVNFGGKALEEHYADKRSEMWDAIRKWLEAGGSLPNDSALKTDLCGPSYSFTAAGKLKLEPKDDLKARGLRSTDLGDALALTFAEPVAVLDADQYLPESAIL